VIATDRGVVDDAHQALLSSMTSTEVGCSVGTISIPDEASTASRILTMADLNMYANKHQRNLARSTRQRARPSDETKEVMDHDMRR
jgi:predicted signal transduction protein with EAL and GGDEF domain